LITFFYFSPACSLATHIALEEAGIAFSPVRVDPRNKPSELLTLNPRGTVPTLAVDGRPLTENVAILDYLDGLAPSSALLPTEPFARARCVSFLSWCATSVHIAFRQFARPGYFSPDTGAHAGISEAGRLAFGEALRQIDERLEGNPYVMGDAFTAADAYPMVFCQWAQLRNVSLSALRNLEAFRGRMLERPAVRRALQREGSPMLAQD
jgi:glutathione S-transferase